jgi:hypothetical protein
MIVFAETGPIPDNIIQLSHHQELQYNKQNDILPANNLSVWGHLNPSPYCGVGRFFCRVFKF